LKANVTKADANWPGLVEKNGVAGGKSLVNVDKKGVALGGYDPVSYFADGKPVMGDEKIEGTYNGALYHFVSQEHRATLKITRRSMRPLMAVIVVMPRALEKCARPIHWSGPSRMASSSCNTPKARQTFG